MLSIPVTENKTYLTMETTAQNEASLDNQLVLRILFRVLGFTAVEITRLFKWFLRIWTPLHGKHFFL